MTKTGDSVKLFRTGGALRLDREDAEALQGLVYEAMSRALGGLIGVGSGCLWVPDFDVDDLSNVAISECVFFWAYPAGGTALLTPEGFVLRHNPSLSGQVSTVNLSAYVAGEGTPYLWARRVEIETTAAARKKWTTVEVDDNTPSRIEERVEFDVATSNPDAAAGWFRFARVTAWDAGVPTILPCSPFDPAADDILTETAIRHRGLRIWQQDFGLRATLTALTSQLTRMMDSDWTIYPDGSVGVEGAHGWLFTPDRGLVQLDADLAALETAAGSTPMTVLSSGAATSLNMSAFGVAFCSGLADGSGTMGPGTSTRVRAAVISDCGVLSTAEMAARSLLGGTGTMWLYFRHPTTIPAVLQLLLTPGRNPVGVGSPVAGVEVANTASFAVGVQGAFGEACFQVSLRDTEVAVDGKVNFIAITEN